MSSANRDDVKDFLSSRRARVQPAQVGLPSGPNRRVAGLRRGEVAMLADVSVEYYSRVERGSLSGVSDGVLHAIAGALLLDEAEGAHLFDLARAANASPVRTRRRSSTPKTLRPALQYTLDAFTAGPAFIRNDRLDLLGANAIGRALYADLYEESDRPNLARAGFLNRDWADAFYPDWHLAVDQSVAILRAAAGHDRTTGNSRTSSGSCRRAARSSARSGAPTTSGATPPARSTSCIRSSARSTCTSRDRG